MPATYSLSPYKSTHGLITLDTPAAYTLARPLWGAEIEVAGVCKEGMGMESVVVVCVCVCVCVWRSGARTLPNQTSLKERLGEYER